MKEFIIQKDNLELFVDFIRTKVDDYIEEDVYDYDYDVTDVQTVDNYFIIKVKTNIYESMLPSNEYLFKVDKLTFYNWIYKQIPKITIF